MALIASTSKKLFYNGESKRLIPSALQTARKLINKKMKIVQHSKSCRELELELYDRRS
jgi:hypothetical protein